MEKWKFCFSMQVSQTVVFKRFAKRKPVKVILQSVSNREESIIKITSTEISKVSVGGSIAFDGRTGEGIREFMTAGFSMHPVSS